MLTLHQIYQVLYEGEFLNNFRWKYINCYVYTDKDVKAAVQELMARPPSKELELPARAGGPAHQLIRKLGLE